MASSGNPLSVNTSSNIDEIRNSSNTKSPIGPATGKVTRDEVTDVQPSFKPSTETSLGGTTEKTGTQDSSSSSSGNNTNDFGVDKFETSEDGGVETPKALDQMMAKFDLLQSSSIDEPDQDRMMQKFELLRKSSIQEDECDDKCEGSKKNTSIAGVLSSETETGVELKADFSQSTNEMSEIEQFRSSDSHLEHGSAISATPISPSNVPKSSQQLLEDRIVELMDQVTTLETKNEELQSKLRIQHNQDVQDMYQNPYSDPFASTSPTKAKGSFNSSTFLESATRNIQSEEIAPSFSISSLQQQSSTVDNSDLHRELTELRIQNQSLQNDLESAEHVKTRLKKLLKSAELEDKQKSEQIISLTNELTETRDREANLQSELDACKIRIEGFEIAQQHARDAAATTVGSGEEEIELTDEGESNNKPLSTRSESIKSFFSGGDSKPSSSPLSMTGDVATALVVSQRQNEALQAHNEELESANVNLQKKCDELTEKYGLKEPAAGDDKGKQLYSRYLEMKSSLSSLSVVLEEVQEQNSKLNERVEELESELNVEDGPEGSADGFVDEHHALTKSISAEQEETLKNLVEKLEVQILDYREAEERHVIVRAQLESTVETLEEEAAALRNELIELKNAPASPEREDRESKLRKELENCYSELESRVTKEKSDELLKELEALRDAMDAAAEESTQLLNEMEALLDSTREELKEERKKYQELETKYKDLLCSNTESNEGESDDDSVGTKEALSNSERLLEENERLNAAVLSLQDQTQQLKIELEKKNIRVEKSEQRLTSKHEKAQQLKEANASLREGIQQLKGHLETISEEASKTEKILASTKSELQSEREKLHKAEMTNETLRTELNVLRSSVAENVDEASSKNIELSASLAATKRELSIERELVVKISQEKNDLVSLHDNTRDDLQSKLLHQKEKISELETQISKLQTEAVARKDLEETLKKTQELVVLETEKVKEMTDMKSSLEGELDAMRQNIKELSAANEALEEQMSAVKSGMNAEATETSRQFNELEKLLATTQQELNEEESRAETLEQQVDDLTNQIEELEKCKSDLQVSFDDVKQEIIAVNSKKAEFESLLQTTKADFAVQMQTMNTMRAESLLKEAEFNGILCKKDEEINDLMKKVLLVSPDELEKKDRVITELTAKLEGLEDITESAERVCVDKVRLEEKTHELQRKLDEKDEKIGELKITLAKLGCGANFTVDEKQEERKSENLEKENAELTSKLDSAKEEMKSLSTSLKYAEDDLSKMKALSKLLTEENTELRSRVEGIHKERKEQGEKASAEVHLWEVEMLLGSTKRELEDARERNALLTGQVRDLEECVDSYQSTNAQTLKESETHEYVSNERAEKVKMLETVIATLKEENESLLQRTAALARRDQLQKASLNTSNEEIAKLMTTMADFQERFENLAEQVEEGQAEKLKHMEEFEEKESSWKTEGNALRARIKTLEEACERLTFIENEKELDSIQHCHTDRSMFNMKVGELEQELQLLQVTLESTREERTAAKKELELTRSKLTECEKELRESRDEMESIIAQIENDLQFANGRVNIVEGEMALLKNKIVTTSEERDTAVTHSEEMSSKVAMLEGQLEVCRAEIIKKEQYIQEIKCELDSQPDSKAVVAREKELQLKYRSCQEELELCQSEKALIEEKLDGVTNQVLEENKKSLKRLEDELNNAHSRESALDEMLSSCQKELLVCKKEIESYDKQLIDEKHGSSVYKDVIAKLNASNDRLEDKNKQLKEEINILKDSIAKIGSERITEENEMLRSENDQFVKDKKKLTIELQQRTTERDSLRASAVSLKKEIDVLKQENQIARVVASDSEIGKEGIEQENLMMKELLATSQLSVAESKSTQQRLTKQIEAATKRENRLSKEILALKAKNEDMEKRVEEQEKELDEFENDFALARSDARKVVEELRSQLLQLEKRNQQLEADSSVGKTEDLKNKLRQLISQNKRMHKEIEYAKVRERRLENQLGLETRRK